MESWIEGEEEADSREERAKKAEPKAEDERESERVDAGTPSDGADRADTA